jgi:hypothetical protein
MEKQGKTISDTNNWLFFVYLLAVTSLLCLPLNAESQHSQGVGGSTTSLTGQAPSYPPMPGPGKKVPIGKDQYLIYGFDKKPKLGTIIMKVEIFTGEGKKDTSMEVKADAGMPSMKGAHEMGERRFKLSNKGDYLLPIPIVMPGDWEIRLTLLKDGKIIFTGSYQFDV